MQNRPRIMISLAWKNIRLNWRHSLATMVAIMAGFTAVALFDGFMASLKIHIDDSYVNKGMLGHLLLEKKDAKTKIFDDPWLYSISKDEQAFAEDFLSDPRVHTVSRFLIVVGLISNGKSSAVFGGVGYDVQEGTKIRGPKWDWNAVAGRPLHKVEEPSLILGTGLAKRLECDFVEHPPLRKDRGYLETAQKFDCANPLMQLSVTTEHSQVNATSLNAVGAMDLQLREFNDRFIGMPLAEAQRLLDTDRITRYSVYLKSGQDIEAVRRDFAAAAARSGRDLELTPWYDHPVAETAKGGMEILRVFRFLFLGVVSVIAAMSVANSMMKSINERIREIGMLRSIGFRRSDIVAMFTGEGFFLGIVSCAAGMLFTLALGWVVSLIGIDFKAGILSTPIPVTITVSLAGWASIVGALTFITTAVSWLVSQRASRMIVADALRYVA